VDKNNAQTQHASYQVLLILIKLKLDDDDMHDFIYSIAAV